LKINELSAGGGGKFINELNIRKKRVLIVSLEMGGKLLKRMN
jgi:hypothetical protein